MQIFEAIQKFEKFWICLYCYILKEIFFSHNIYLFNPTVQLGRYYKFSQACLSSRASMHAQVCRKLLLLGIHCNFLLEFGRMMLRQMDKIGQKWLFFFFLKVLFFPGSENNIFFFIFHCKPIIWHNSDSKVMCQNHLSQSDCRILRKCILKKDLRDTVTFVDHSETCLECSILEMTCQIILIHAQTTWPCK